MAMKPKHLESAIRSGDLEKVRELIASGMDVSTVLTDGIKPIQLAAREGQITIIRALAGAGADLSDLETLDLEARLRLFVESSLDDEPGDDLLSSEELSAWALQAAGESMDPETASQIADMEGALFRAVRTDDLELLRERIAAGDPVDPVMEITRDTPLTQALQKRREDMVRELLAAGANIDHVGFGTPLCFALPDLRLAKILIDAGADVYGRGLDRLCALERAAFRALHPSSSEDSALLVRFFLETGVDPTLSEAVEGTMLLDAQMSEAWELYHELLPHYPDEVALESFEELRDRQDRRDFDGGLMDWSIDVRFAAREGDLEELERLLTDCRSVQEAGKAIFEVVAHLQMPADDAAASGNAGLAERQLEAIERLIDAGADLDVGSGYEKRRGSTPLSAAAESWHPRSRAVLKLLLDAGARVDQRGSFERTPLMYAVLVAYRHGAALKKALPVLLKAGADPNLIDGFGYSAWTLAMAPLIEEEEGGRGEDVFFDGPDLSEFHGSGKGRRTRLDRCRKAILLLEEAGATARGEAELRLVLAAAAGNPGRVQELLAAGASADARHLDGRSALVLAAQSGSLECAQCLIQAGCDVGASAAGQPSALEVAVRAADPVMTRLLLDAGANATMLVYSLSGALADAEAAGASEVVEMIRGSVPPSMAHGDRDVEEEIAASDLAHASQGALPSHAALGDLEKASELLAVPGVEINGHDGLCRTALSSACEAGHVELVRELIALGADVGLCNAVVGSPRSTSLAAAAIGASAERDAVLRLLLEAGADPDQLGADGRTALMHAVERDVGFFGRIGEPALSTRTLVDAGADLEIRDPFGLTAWMRAMSLYASIDIEEVADQYKAIADLLEKAGASTSGRPEVELLWASMVGAVDQVRDLLESGASPNARRHDGPTALILAVRDGNPDIVRLLIEAGCDINAREWVDRGRTAAESAADGRRRDLVRMLEKADSSSPD